MQLCKILGSPVALETILSIMDGEAKSVSDIALQNNNPLSSTYKAIRTLEKSGLVLIEKVVIDASGRRVALYKSRIKSFQLRLDKKWTTIAD